jgi:hypothetical protein
MEADSLVCVKDTSFPDHRLESAHATDDLGDCDITNLGISLCFDILQKLTLLGNDFSQSGFQIWFGRRGEEAALG